MTDNKRQSVGGSRSGTSTPKSAASAKGPVAGPGELDFGKILGARVKVTTVTPATTIEGTIYTACPITNLLAISSVPLAATPTQSASYHLIPVSRIQSFTILEVPPPTPTQSTTSIFENAQPPIARVDLKALKAKEEAAVRRAKEQDAMIGKGVTKEAQDIFNAFARMYPARWHETSIVVNDSVIVKSPYRPEDCSAPKDKSTMLDRMKRVLENERKKLGLASSTSITTTNGKAPGPSVGVGAGRGAGTAVATPVLPRKGG